MVKKGRKAEFEGEKDLPRKTTKKLAQSKPKTRVTRQGRIDIKTDHPEGKERFNELFKKMVNPDKSE